MVERASHADFGFCFNLALATLLACAGCEKPPATAAPPSPAPPVSNNLHLDHAQPKLPTMKLWLGSQEVVAELAVTPTQVATGMMFRKEIAESEGMLFIFGLPDHRSFYMKNVPIPLTCAYIGSDGTILEIHDMKAHDESPIHSASDKVQYVLEMKQGWFERNKIATGTLVRTERGSFEETFHGVAQLR
jgi:uncharacterized membrane protein (UPF0127 family)